MAFATVRERNPDLVDAEKKKFIMRPPQVARAGSKNTASANFAEICRILKRQQKHVLQFLIAELGTTGICHVPYVPIIGDGANKRYTAILFGVSGMWKQVLMAAIKSGFTAMVGRHAAFRYAAETTTGR
uniref:Eukaryotic translation initiation factor 2 subunit 2 n=1 Tax=Ascaris lumbricoides TaxID=6252 RepID=A0A0M3I6T0_ASCLU